MIERLLLWCAVASVVLGQDSSTATESSDSTSSSTSDASSASETGSATTRASLTHTVDVGLAGHTYQPDVILADTGDTIEFNFFPTNHSVIRAEYLRPCVPYEMVSRNNVGKGFNSDFLPVDAILEEPPTFSIVINDTDPIFFYCGAEGSCINWQMVGVINPNSSTSLQAHKDAAEKSTFMLLPGEKWPDEASDPMNSDSTSPSSPSSTSSSSSSSNDDSSGSSSSMSTGAIAGIAVSATIAVIAAAALVFFCGRQSRRKKELNKQQQAPLMQQQNPTSPDPSNFMRMSMQPYPTDMYKQGSMMQFDPNQSAALPGYVPQQGDSRRNTYMAPMYGASEALNAGPAPNGTPHASPNMGAVPAPAYGSVVPGHQQQQQQQQQQGYFSPPMQPADHYHEMPVGAAAPSPGKTLAKTAEVGELGGSSPSADQQQQQQQGSAGIMGFIKQNTGSI